MSRRVQRYFGLGLLLAMAGFAAVGYFSIRRDVDNLRIISQDNILWTAMQMEVELLRFKLSLATLEIEATPEALEEVGARFDILWSRVFMMGSGRVGELIRRYDLAYDSIPAFQAYLETLDPVIAGLGSGDGATIRAILGDLDVFQRDLRLYTLRVVRGDTAATAAVRDRIQFNSQTTMIVSLAAVLLSLLALALILRENRRQREMTDLSRQVASEAELSSRAKSRFLAMMSHELRNPLNGVLGPLALLGQADLPPRHERLVQQAQQSGTSMVQLIGGLLDYGEMQDGRLTLRAEPFRPTALVAGVRSDLDGVGAGDVRIELDGASPDLVHGDMERLRSVFVHLSEYISEGSAPGQVRIRFGYEGETLVAEIDFAAPDATIDWKLDLMMGLNEIAPDRFATEALRPLIARELVVAAGGFLSVIQGADGKRSIRVAIPAAQVRYERIRVRLETRSAALATIYRAALRSDRIVFIDPEAEGPVDMVLIDATSVTERHVMGQLRARFRDALFVSLGAPKSPDSFDDIVETPADMRRLRSSILGRLAG